MDLPVQAGVVFLERLNPPFLCPDGESGLYPAHQIVLFDEQEKHEHGGYHYGKADERALLSPVPVLVAVPYILKFSHNHKIN